MSCSRRDFISGVGAVIAVAGTTGLATSQLSLATEKESKTIRYAMLHDEQACIGCTACMDACRETNKVPEGVSRLEIIRSQSYGEFPNVKYEFFRQSCQHCSNAPCVSVCPTGASFIDKATGIVDVNPDLCVGCAYCIAVCPYRVRYIEPVKKTADKCNFCRDTNLAQGKQPACVESCPTKALTFGDLNDPNSDISRLIKEKPTYRTKMELGTEPNLYHIKKGEAK
ncbi:cytochrome c nitrite reductase Fe-S protein [Glaesserella parasuis]|nr:cytochrome c nitrite reductase Fe-S protein [Glaesserella parasuis]MDO9834277.1 cytochrome c nitrite reductase Fe-S protein [Glaesserella parasuis]